MFRTSAVCLLWLVAPSSFAQNAFWPGVTYDSGVPTMEQVLGHAPGMRIVSHAEMLQYLDALVEARPQQIQVHDYAESWEGRALVYAVVGSVENMARTADIQRDMKRLSDPRTISDADARAIPADSVDGTPDTVITRDSVGHRLPLALVALRVADPDVALIARIRAVARSAAATCPTGPTRHIHRTGETVVTLLAYD